MTAETRKIVSLSYCKTCESHIRLCWLPSPKEKFIGEITKDDLKTVLADKRIQSLVPKTINGIIDSITIPLKWAFNEATSRTFVMKVFEERQLNLRNEIFSQWKKQKIFFMVIIGISVL